MALVGVASGDLELGQSASVSRTPEKTHAKISHHTPNIKNKYFFLIVRAIQLLTYPVSRIMTWLMRLEVVDENGTRTNIDQNVILAASHFSEIDILLVPTIFKPFSRHFPIRYFTFDTRFYKTQIAGKNLLKKIFYGGWLFRLCGSCEFDRTQSKKPYHVKLRDHIDLLVRLGHTLLIYPSGHIHADGSVPQVKPGAAVLSYYSGRPVVPMRVFIDGKITLSNVLFRRVRLRFVIGRQLSQAKLFPGHDDGSRASHISDASPELARANQIIFEEFESISNTIV